MLQYLRREALQNASAELPGLVDLPKFSEQFAFGGLCVSAILCVLCAVFKLIPSKRNPFQSVSWCCYPLLISIAALQGLQFLLSNECVPLAPSDEMGFSPCTNLKIYWANIGILLMCSLPISLSLLLWGVAETKTLKFVQGFFCLLCVVASLGYLLSIGFCPWEYFNGKSERGLRATVLVTEPFLPTRRLKWFFEPNTLSASLEDFLARFDLVKYFSELTLFALSVVQLLFPRGPGKWLSVCLPLLSILSLFAFLSVEFSSKTVDQVWHGLKEGEFPVRDSATEVASLLLPWASPLLSVWFLLLRPLFLGVCCRRGQTPLSASRVAFSEQCESVGALEKSQQQADAGGVHGGLIPSAETAETEVEETGEAPLMQMQEDQRSMAEGIPPEERERQRDAEVERGPGFANPMDILDIDRTDQDKSASSSASASAPPSRAATSRGGKRQPKKRPADPVLQGEGEVDPLTASDPVAPAGEEASNSNVSSRSHRYGLRPRK
uniref:Uncharacterized protein n=1 Tax=Chromera velia CCMP2878 TaxID=1169474 RepID=A0A0G4HY02_9ALVE|eukprot:Cvel_9388.t1-p1 / transcript=Cvel_9388.t1 / gene=Cvel_9388 / organism=Chromera_velia_CCMP2878 / gene_product=hypothetical protein / transcript_product=hypothetical protein / location=Cvel_scaffold539:44860-47104(+) / protein_length=494 / sequence_SO=supercontig / SO=protein_coding / is_pseudo=false